MPWRRGDWGRLTVLTQMGFLMGRLSGFLWVSGFSFGLVACGGDDTSDTGAAEYEGDEAGECSDDGDNDRDGDFDCDDDGCKGSPECD